MTLEIPLRKRNLDQKGILIWNELSNHLSNTLQNNYYFLNYHCQNYCHHYYT